jgi:hypothetical protein
MRKKMYKGGCRLYYKDNGISGQDSVGKALANKLVSISEKALYTIYRDSEMLKLT